MIFFSGIDEKLIEEVLGLDLFDHDGVTYKVADLGNACWVERHGTWGNGLKVCCHPTLPLEIYACVILCL